jgi:hypothetical protein
MQFGPTGAIQPGFDIRLVEHQRHPVVNCSRQRVGVRDDDCAGLAVPSGSIVTPLPHPTRRTGQAVLPHPALGRNLTPSPTPRRAQARSSARARSVRKGAERGQIPPLRRLTLYVMRNHRRNRTAACPAVRAVVHWDSVFAQAAISGLFAACAVDVASWIV